MGDAILTALVIGLVMWGLLFILYFILGLIMTAAKNIGKEQKKYYNISLFRYDRPTTMEFDRFGQMIVGGLKMVSEITALGFIITLIICVIAALT